MNDRNHIEIIRHVAEVDYDSPPDAPWNPTKENLALLLHKHSQEDGDVANAYGSLGADWANRIYRETWSLRQRDEELQTTYGEDIRWLGRCIGLNEKFQLLAIVVDREVICLPGGFLEKLEHEAEVMWGMGLRIKRTISASEAIKHVLSPDPTLTICSIEMCGKFEHENLMSVLNSNRDTMGATTGPATLLVVVSAKYLAEIGMCAQDIWSCRSATVQIRPPA